MNKKWSLVASTAQGVLLAILLLEAFGAGLVAVNWWIYRDGLLLGAMDKFFAAIVILFMTIIPIFGVVVLSALRGVVKFNFIGISLFSLFSLFFYSFLVIFSFFFVDFPWAMDIILGKSFDLMIGLLSFFVLLVWSLIVRRNKSVE
ncbi:hypothetical protein [Acidovorax sp.]|jgi:hypothetical protein|uniref:hypothetical protein n=1 Tax=Acidovorax sp. TaxID=1872122 RepID=UPI00391F21D4